MSTYDEITLEGADLGRDRLRLQSLMWEEAGRALLANLGDGRDSVALDVGCGAMSWLRLLSDWVGERGRVIGTDVDVCLLDEAEAFIEAAELRNVSVAQDDLFNTRLEDGQFDLLHSRFQIAPLGRGIEQMDTYLKLLRPGGWLVLEDPDSSSWHFNPHAPAAQRLIELLRQAFAAGGGDLDVGTKLPALFARFGIEAETRAHVIALPPMHPYLRLPLVWADSLRPRLQRIVSREELDGLMVRAKQEIESANTWGTTFTLIQAFGRAPR